MRRILKVYPALLISLCLIIIDTVYAEAYQEGHRHDLVYAYVSEDRHMVICASCDLEAVEEECVFDESGICIRCSHRKEGSAEETGELLSFEAGEETEEVIDSCGIEDTVKNDEASELFEINFLFETQPSIHQVYQEEATLNAPAAEPYIDKYGIHTFRQWVPELCETVTESIDYAAEYELKEENKAVYRYIWRDYDGSILKDSCGFLDTVDISEPQIPDRPGDAGFQYQFKEWVSNETLESAYSKWKEEGADISRQIIIENTAVYFAYASKDLVHTVSFQDYDGRTIREEILTSGAVLCCPPDPERESDGEYSYVFRGWSPKPEITCTHSAVYTAMYEKVILSKKHTIIFRDWNGEELSRQLCATGEAVVPPSEPAREADDYFDYRFDGWTPEVNDTCLKDMIYTARYAKTSIIGGNSHTITFLDYDGSLISEKEYADGEMIDIPANPVRAAKGRYSFAFRKWMPEPSETAVQDSVYTATYIQIAALSVDEDGESENTIQKGIRDTFERQSQISENGSILIRFLDWDGAVISEKAYAKGDEIEIPEDPKRQADSRYSYEFRNWSPAVSETAEQSLDYWPQFIKTKNE